MGFVIWRVVIRFFRCLHQASLRVIGFVPIRNHPVFAVVVMASFLLVFSRPINVWVAGLGPYVPWHPGDIALVRPTTSSCVGCVAVLPGFRRYCRRSPLPRVVPCVFLVVLQFICDFVWGLVRLWWPFWS